MKFVVGLIVLILALGLHAPFLVAAALAVGAGALAHYLRGEGAAGGAATAAGEGPQDLRSQVLALADRVRALEKEVTALRGIPIQDAEIRPPEPVERTIQEPVAEEFLDGKPAVESLTPAPEPASPSLIARLFSGNVVAKVGAIVLFFGVGFLLKFAYDRDMVPPQLRLLGVAAAAAVLIGLGWRLLEKRRLYGVILQGAGFGLAYLDVYFALKTYGFIGAPLGFALFAALGVVTTLLAVRLEAPALATLGLTGAFLAPILASTGGGNVAVLFSYYLLLNLFILAVSWWRAWRGLNLTGWFFTLAVGVLWGSRSYRPELFGTVEPFLLAFFAIYLVIPVLFATRQPPELRGWVDGTLVFGTPAAVAALQARLVWDMPHGLAWSSALGAGLYALLSFIVFRHRNMRLLGETYVALAAGLATLAIFFAFGAFATFALWTIEGTAILWVCMRQKSLAGRVFGLVVQLAGAGYFFLRWEDYALFNPWFDDAVLGCAIIAAASFISAALYHRFAGEGHPGERWVGGALVAWGVACSMIGALEWIHEHLSGGAAVHAALGFAALSALGYRLLGGVLAWPAMRTAAGLPWIAIPLALLADFSGGNRHPFGDAWSLAWPLALGLGAWLLREEEREAERMSAYRHGVLLYAPILLATWELAWWLSEWKFGGAWRLAAYAVPAAAVLRSALAGAGRAWPLDARRWPGYRDGLLPVLVVYLAVWAFASDVGQPGTLAPLSTYVPLLNPTDVAMALAAWTATAWVRAKESAAQREVLWKGLGALGFLWLNAIALRSIHYWYGVPYTFDALAGSVLVQATLSILWTSAALALMLLARARMERKLWFAGSALLAVVVGKLFLVDLASSGTVARIVSFLGVGALLLVIGYVAPVPPGEQEGKGTA